MKARARSNISRSKSAGFSQLIALHAEHHRLGFACAVHSPADILFVKKVKMHALYL